MALRAGFAIAICYVLIGLVTDQYQLLMGRALVGFANGFIQRQWPWCPLVSMRNRLVGL